MSQVQKRPSPMVLLPGKSGGSTWFMHGYDFFPTGQDCSGGKHGQGSWAQHPCCSMGLAAMISLS